MDYDFYKDVIVSETSGFTGNFVTDKEREVMLKFLGFDVPRPYTSSYFVKTKPYTSCICRENIKFDGRGKGLGKILNALESNNEEKGYQKKLK